MPKEPDEVRALIGRGDRDRCWPLGAERLHCVTAQSRAGEWALRGNPDGYAPIRN